MKKVLVAVFVGFLLSGCAVKYPQGHILKEKGDSVKIFIDLMYADGAVSEKVKAAAISYCAERGKSAFYFAYDYTVGWVGLNIYTTQYAWYHCSKEKMIVSPTNRSTELMWTNLK